MDMAQACDAAPGIVAQTQEVFDRLAAAIDRMEIRLAPALTAPYDEPNCVAPGAGCALEDTVWSIRRQVGRLVELTDRVAL